MKRTLIALLLAGCIYPGKATRQERLDTASEERVRYCDGDVESTLEKIRQDIHSTEPLYARLRTGPKNNNYSTKLVGARLYVPSHPGLTPQELERMLHCHQARSVLGEIPASAADPFSIPDGWIDIQVQPERWGLVVQLRGQTAEESQLIDSKAQALAAAGERH